MINKYEGDNTALSKLPQIFFPTNLNEIRSLDDFIGANTRSQRVVPSEASTAPMKVTLTKAENTNPNGTLSRLQNLQLDEQEQKANDESFLGDKRTTPIGPDMEDIKTKVKVEGRRKRKKHAVLVGLIGSKDASLDASLGQDVSSRPSNSRKSRASFAAVVNTLDQPSELGATRKTPKLISFKRKISSSQYKGVLYVRSQSKWRAQVCLGGKKKYIGSYDTELEAALARDKKVRDLFGNKKEMLNFPEKDLMPKAYPFQSVDQSSFAPMHAHDPELMRYLSEYGAYSSHAPAFQFQNSDSGFSTMDCECDGCDAEADQNVRLTPYSYPQPKSTYHVSGLPQPQFRGDSSLDFYNARQPTVTPLVIPHDFSGAPSFGIPPQRSGWAESIAPSSTYDESSFCPPFYVDCD